MRRGDVVIASARGDFAGKPRPALVVQSDAFNPFHPSVSLCPITSELMGDNYFRVALTPSASNGLDQASEIQVDKVQSVRREKIDRVVGEVTSIELETVDELLRRWLDL